VVFSSKSLPGFFQTGSGVFSAALGARAFDATNHLEKAPGHCVRVKRSFISIFENDEFTCITQFQPTKLAG